MGRRGWETVGRHFPAWAWAALTLTATLSTAAGLFLLQLQRRSPQALLPKRRPAGREHPCHLQGEDPSRAWWGVGRREERRESTGRNSLRALLILLTTLTLPLECVKDCWVKRKQINCVWAQRKPGTVLECTGR